MENSLLTLVMPVYNTENYLGRCIESVTNQTMNNIYIIIINDGSTDNSDKIIKKYTAKNKNINYINLDKNIGVGHARNIGIENAKTKYIAFIDSDDWVDAAYYEHMLQNIEQDQTDICISGIITELDDIYSWKYRYNYPKSFVVEGDFCIHSLNNQYNHDITFSPIVNNRIYKKNLLTDNNIFFNETRRAQDLYFSFMVFIYTDKASICHDVFYHYYQRIFSATHNFSKKYVNDYFFVLSELQKELIKRGLYSLYKDEYISYVYHYMTKLVNNMFYNVQIVTEQKDYIMYILKKASKLISIEKIIEFIDIEKLKSFWRI